MGLIANDGLQDEQLHFLYGPRIRAGNGNTHMSLHIKGDRLRPVLV